MKKFIFRTMKNWEVADIFNGDRQYILSYEQLETETPHLVYAKKSRNENLIFHWKMGVLTVQNEKSPISKKTLDNKIIGYYKINSFTRILISTLKQAQATLQADSVELSLGEHKIPFDLKTALKNDKNEFVYINFIDAYLFQKWQQPKISELKNRYKREMTRVPSDNQVVYWGELS